MFVAERVQRLKTAAQKLPVPEGTWAIGADIDEMLQKPDDPKWMKYSVEFCGGTHVKNSGEVERFVIVSEEGVAKGVRRVVGVVVAGGRQGRAAVVAAAGGEGRRKGADRKDSQQKS